MARSPVAMQQLRSNSHVPVYRPINQLRLCATFSLFVCLSAGQVASANLRGLHPSRIPEPSMLRKMTDPVLSVLLNKMKSSDFSGALGEFEAALLLSHQCPAYSAACDISIPSGFTTISPGAFQSTNITAVSIPASMKIVDDYAFKSCLKLKSVSFENHSFLTRIGKSAFKNTSITRIKIPAVTKTIDEDAFALCHKLANLTFETDSRLTDIGTGAFGNTAIAQVIIPASVRRIYDYAFQYCPNLTSLRFARGSTLTEIGTFAALLPKPPLLG